MPPTYRRRARPNQLRTKQKATAHAKKGAQAPAGPSGPSTPDKPKRRVKPARAYRLS